MKKLLLLATLLLAANIASAQYSADKEFEYTVTFEKSTFQNEDAKQIVREFREHIFATQGVKSDFTTRFDESGTIYFKSANPVKECCIEKFFADRNKTYLSFEQVIQKPTLYAFGS